jgi:hypothetical protein
VIEPRSQRKDAPPCRALPPNARIEDRLARGGGAIELLHVPAALFAFASKPAPRPLRPRPASDRSASKLPVDLRRATYRRRHRQDADDRLARERAGRERPAPGHRLARLRRARRRSERRSAALSELVPDVPHVLDADRARGARKLLASRVDGVLLDDGFQHRRLRRRSRLVLVDATRPWGFARSNRHATRRCSRAGLLARIAARVWHARTPW